MALPYVSCFVAWCCGTVQNGAERCCPISIHFPRFSLVFWNGAERCGTVLLYLLPCCIVFFGTSSERSRRELPYFPAYIPMRRACKRRQQRSSPKSFVQTHESVSRISDALGQQEWYRGIILDTAKKVEYCSPFLLGAQAAVLCVTKVIISTRGMVENSRPKSTSIRSDDIKTGFAIFANGVYSKIEE